MKPNDSPDLCRASLPITAAEAQWLIALHTFAAREGHATVPFRHVEDGLRLGAWIARVRNHRADLPTELRARLEATPDWTWHGRASRGEAKWDAAYTRLTQYVTSVGHACVPTLYVAPDSFRLGAWVAKQRRDQDTLTAARRARLTALAGWSWDGTATRGENAWTAAYTRLCAFVAREGTALVPQAHKSTDGFCLGSWVHEQRASRNALSVAQRDELEKLAGWTWNVRTTRAHDRSTLFAERVLRLSSWAARNGDACPPSRARDTDGFRLGEWVTHVRASRAQLTPAQQQALESIPGWSWTGLGRGVGRWRRQELTRNV